LHIVGRRDDGYHLLQSAFMLIDWCDTLALQPTQRREDQSGRPDLGAAGRRPRGPRRARLQQATGCTAGAHIAIHKSDPRAGRHGWRLIRMLHRPCWRCNRLVEPQATLGRLLEIGLTLGADVPFFLGGRNAWVEGIGERSTPIEYRFRSWVVVKPERRIGDRKNFL